MKGPQVQVCVRVPRKLAYRLADRAREADRSVSAELRRAIRLYLLELGRL